MFIAHLYTFVFIIKVLIRFVPLQVIQSGELVLFFQNESTHILFHQVL